MNGIYAGKNLRNIDFSGVNLVAEDLSNANLMAQNLERFNFTHTNLSCANMRRATLKKAILRGADLSRVKIKGTNLESARLEGAFLEDSDLYQVVGCGSIGRCTTYNAIDDKVICGCFYGSLASFKGAVEAEYGAKQNANYKTYQAAILYFESIAKLYD